MSGRKKWLVVALALMLGAGVALAVTRLVAQAPAASIDPIRLQSPNDRSRDGQNEPKKDGKRAKDKHKKGGSKPSGASEPPSSGGAPPAPPAPPAPAGDDDDDGNDTDDGGGDGGDD